MCRAVTQVTLREPEFGYCNYIAASLGAVGLLATGAVASKATVAAGSNDRNSIGVTVGTSAATFAGVTAAAYYACTSQRTLLDISTAHTVHSCALPLAFTPFEHPEYLCVAVLVERHSYAFERSAKNMSCSGAERRVTEISVKFPGTEYKARRGTPPTRSLKL